MSSPIVVGLRCLAPWSVLRGDLRGKKTFPVESVFHFCPAESHAMHSQPRARSHSAAVVLRTASGRGCNTAEWIPPNWAEGRRGIGLRALCLGAYGPAKSQTTLRSIESRRPPRAQVLLTGCSDCQCLKRYAQYLEQGKRLRPL
jgi:hypothetical protein